MDFIIYIILLLIGGCFAGLMAGMLGIGGGIILTPILYYLFLAEGVDAKIALTMTFATSLAVICVTMINSSRQHYKNKFIVTYNLKTMLLLGFIGSILGALTSKYVNYDLLKIIFGVLCILSVFCIAIIKVPQNDKLLNKNKLTLDLISLIGGILSGLIGPAGGTILIPIFIAYLKYPMHKTIGTTSILSIPTAIGGILMYTYLGMQVPNLTSYSIGYIALIPFIILTITSIPVSTYAARLSKKVNNKILKILQVIIITYKGLQMMGIIDLILSFI